MTDGTRSRAFDDALAVADLGGDGSDERSVSDTIRRC
jgi:hypothetical protein